MKVLMFSSDNAFFFTQVKEICQKDKISHLLTCLKTFLIKIVILLICLFVRRRSKLHVVARSGSSVNAGLFWRSH